MSENTLNAALRRMGFKNEDMTSRGFRASASSMLNESGLWNPDAIERQLAHVDGDSVRRAYARTEFWGRASQDDDVVGGEVRRIATRRGRCASPSLTGGRSTGCPELHN
jgi:integrase